MPLICHEMSKSVMAMKIVVVLTVSTMWNLLSAHVRPAIL